VRAASILFVIGQSTRAAAAGSQPLSSTGVAVADLKVIGERRLGEEASRRWHLPEGDGIRPANNVPRRRRAEAKAKSTPGSTQVPDCILSATR
jgi:hypothetical protein